MTWVLVAITVLTVGFGQIAMTKGMKASGEIHDFRPHAWLRSFLRALKNVWLMLGFLCMAISFFSFMTLLSRDDLSFAVPATAASYVIQTLGAHYFLGERVSGVRWAGTLLVMAGVALISWR